MREPGGGRRSYAEDRITIHCASGLCGRVKLPTNVVPAGSSMASPGRAAFRAACRSLPTDTLITRAGGGPSAVSMVTRGSAGKDGAASVVMGFAAKTVPMSPIPPGPRRPAGEMEKSGPPRPRVAALPSGPRATTARSAPMMLQVRREAMLTGRFGTTRHRRDRGSAQADLSTRPV